MVYSCISTFFKVLIIITLWSTHSPTLLRTGSCFSTLYMHSRRPHFHIKNNYIFYTASLQLKSTLSLLLCCCCLVTQSYPTLVTLWTAARQAPLSMGFPRQGYWSGLPFPPPGHLPDPGIKPASPALQAHPLPLSHWGSPSPPLWPTVNLSTCA